MQAFGYMKVRSEDDAITASQRGGRYIAGGTTLVDLMREGIERPHQLIDINALPLGRIDVKRGNVTIGSLARMAEVAEHPSVAAAQPLLQQALLEGASPQLRNMASIGGNLMQRVRCPYFRQLDAPCNKRQPGSGCSALDGLQTNHAILGTSDKCVATHPSDLAVALVALEATMRVRGSQGERAFPVESLFLFPAQTPHLEHALTPNELILSVFVPHGPYRRTAYLKVRDRSSYEFALVSVAVALDLRGGIVRGVRLAAGGVGTRPWRLQRCESALIGRRYSKATLEAAAKEACLGATTLPGNRYKLDLLPRTIVRAIEIAGELA